MIFTPSLMLFMAAVVFLAFVANTYAGRRHLGAPRSRPRAQFGGVATFVPEVWSRKLLSSLKKSIVIAAPGVVNRDYEGEINEAGDTVHINSVSRPTISTYTPGSTTITPEQLTTAQRNLTVDQAKYFAFAVDDVDKRQALGGLMEEATMEAAYGLADVADQYVEGLMRSAASNDLSTVQVDGAVDVYDLLLIPAKVKLDEANVPQEGRYALLTPWLHGRILGDDRFIRADATGQAAASINGVVGTAAGFSLRVSNNLPLITGDDYSFLAGHPMAVSYAEQINKTEAYRPESSFSDAIKGLHLYGAKVVRPEALVKAAASKT